MQRRIFRELLVFSALLVLPGLAVFKLSAIIEWRLIIVYLSLLSVVTIGTNWQDKRSAKNGTWRIPERSLHLLEFLGGWPAAFLTQRILRHKTQKRSYRIVFASIVAVYQIAAIDIVTDKRLSQWLSSLIA